jgi:hypothetical protein
VDKIAVLAFKSHPHVARRLRCNAPVRRIATILLLLIITTWRCRTTTITISPGTTTITTTIIIIIPATTIVVTRENKNRSRRSGFWQSLLGRFLQWDRSFTFRPTYVADYSVFPLRDEARDLFLTVAIGDAEEEHGVAFEL